MKIFISYRRAEDNKSNIVWTIHDKLSQAFGSDNVFRDTKGIHGGEKWKAVLDREVHTCKVMVVVIGPDWANLRNPEGQKRLFDEKDITRWEVETGLKRSREEGITLIPVRVLGAQIPQKEELPESLWQLFDLQWRELQNSHFDVDMEELISDIRRSKAFMEDDISIAGFEPDTIYIDEGPFWMGSDPGEGIARYETPKEKVKGIEGYRIGKYPVTNLQYAEFIRQPKTRILPPVSWNRQKIPEGLEHCPVVGVTWYDAWAYCQWLSEETNRSYSLPNEAQWEKACRGGNDFFFPWGNEFDPARCNHGQSAIAPIKKYPAQNDFGGFDFVGNVEQWTCSLWGNERPMPDPKYVYPWKKDQRNDPNASREVYRVVRGSTFRQDVNAHRCSARRGEIPELSGMISFRVVLNLK